MTLRLDGAAAEATMYAVWMEASEELAARVEANAPAMLHRFYGYASISGAFTTPNLQEAVIYKNLKTAEKRAAVETTHEYVCTVVPIEMRAVLNLN